MTIATWLMLIALAVALAADAFAVALCQGAAGRVRFRDALRIGTAFGAAQTLMPLLGWAAGGQKLGRKAEVLGGIALLLIGTKVLVTHVFFGGRAGPGAAGALRSRSRLHNYA